MRSKIFTGSLILAFASTSTVAFAQAAPQGSDENVGLEDIVVTATKRNENLQDVPVAVSAISAASLQNKGVFETSDLGNTMPNLQVSSPYGEQQPNFSVRGVGVGTEFNANAASPVGVYVDEVYQAFSAPAMVSSFTIWSRSKSCVARKARFMAATRRAARSTSSPASPLWKAPMAR